MGRPDGTLPVPVTHRGVRFLPPPNPLGPEREQEASGETEGKEPGARRRRPGPISPARARGSPAAKVPATRAAQLGPPRLFHPSPKPAGLCLETSPEGPAPQAGAACGGETEAREPGGWHRQGPARGFAVPFLPGCRRLGTEVPPLSPDPIRSPRLIASLVARPGPCFLRPIIYFLQVRCCGDRCCSRAPSVARSPQRVFGAFSGGQSGGGEPGGQDQAPCVLPAGARAAPRGRDKPPGLCPASCPRSNVLWGRGRPGWHR